MTEPFNNKNYIIIISPILLECFVILVQASVYKTVGLGPLGICFALDGNVRP